MLILSQEVVILYICDATLGDEAVSDYARIHTGNV